MHPYPTLPYPASAAAALSVLIDGLCSPLWMSPSTSLHFTSSLALSYIILTHSTFPSSCPHPHLKPACLTLSQTSLRCSRRWVWITFCQLTCSAQGKGTKPAFSTALYLSKPFQLTPLSQNTLKIIFIPLSKRWSMDSFIYWIDKLIDLFIVARIDW